MSQPTLRIAVAGAGLIGKRHVAAIARCDGVALAAIVDPDPATASYAAQLGVPRFESLAGLLRADRPDGVVLATPNRVHVENGLECVAAGCPLLVEKPLATSAAEAAVLVDAARAADVPIQVGHHRRHSPLIRKAREVIDGGALGALRSVHLNCWLYKPDDYFEQTRWRREPGAGPVSVNLVHDIDLVRYLCGEVVGVQAQAAASRRGHANEDVAAAVLTFADGAIGTVSVSDTIVAPWSWELTARENPVYPPVAESCYLLGGSRGSLSLPDLRLWRYDGPRSWWQPLSATSLPRGAADPLIEQIARFAAVVAGAEAPLVSGEEGLKTLRVIEAIQQSARTERLVRLAD